MLSGETASGEHFKDAVTIMVKTCSIDIETKAIIACSESRTLIDKLLKSVPLSKLLYFCK